MSEALRTYTDARTEDTNPDIDADFILSNDTSAGIHKKVKYASILGTILKAIRNISTPADDSFIQWKTGAPTARTLVQVQADLAAAPAVDTTNTVTFTSSHYNLPFFWAPTGTATATLPANGAPRGTFIDVYLITDQSVTISAATADTLITDGDLAADSVAFSTASHKIGSMVRFISNGSFWIAINLGGTTMTIAS